MSEADFMFYITRLNFFMQKMLLDIEFIIL